MADEPDDAAAVAPDERRAVAASDAAGTVIGAHAPPAETNAVTDSGLTRGPARVWIAIDVAEDGLGNSAPPSVWISMRYGKKQQPRPGHAVCVDAAATHIQAAWRGKGSRLEVDDRRTLAREEEIHSQEEVLKDLKLALAGRLADLDDWLEQVRATDDEAAAAIQRRFRASRG